MPVTMTPSAWRIITESTGSVRFALPLAEHEGVSAELVGDADNEGFVAFPCDLQRERRQVPVDDRQAARRSNLCSRKVRRIVRSLIVEQMRMGASPLSVTSNVVRSVGTERPLSTDRASHAWERGYRHNLA